MAERCQYAPCGNFIINPHPWIEKLYCNRGCQNKAYRDRNFVRKNRKVRDYALEWQTRKRHALIKQFIGTADNETLRLAILNFGTLNTLVGYIHDEELR